MLSPWTIERDDVDAAMDVYRSLHDQPQAKRSDVVRSLLRMMGANLRVLLDRMAAEPLPPPPKAGE